MSILDKASLIQIPSGYKNGKLYSVKPTPTYGSELVTNGDFATDSDWTKGTGWSISGGKANCDGSQTGNTLLYQNVGHSANKTYLLTFTISNYSSGQIDFALDSPFGGTTSGNGDYQVTLQPTSGGNFIIRANSTFIGSIDNVSVKEATNIGDFDFSRSSSGTRVNSEGLIEEMSANVPRLDYSDGSCASLLLEGQSTNLVTYSEDYSHSSWTKVNASVSSNTTTSPSGATNASTLVSTSGTSEQYLDVGSLSVTSGEDYTMSVFVKKNSYDFFLIRFTGVGGAFSAGNVFFNINNGTLGTVDSGYTGSIESFGNGWYRCSATKNASGTTASGKVRLQLATSDNTESITGDGSSGTFIYGSQFEQSSFATSYIPSNSGSSTTRTADVCNNAGTSATFNSTEGVLFAEIAALVDDGTNRILSLSEDGNNNNRVTIFYTSGSNKIKFTVRLNGANEFDETITLSNILDYNKVALKFAENNFAVYINGVKEEEQLSGSIYSANTLDKLSFDKGDGSLDFYGKTKQLMVFDEALSDEELSDLTGQANLSFNNLATFYGYTIL